MRVLGLQRGRNIRTWRWGKGAEESRWSESEKKQKKVLPEGWAWIKLENPLAGEREMLMVLGEEAERWRRKEKGPPDPS